MAQGKIDIINSALVKIGAEVILSLTDDKKEAQVAGVRYDSVRRAVLRSHPWNSATKREVISPSSKAPDFDFTYQFPLPADCLRVLDVDIADDVAYRVEARMILTDHNEINLKYVYDLEDTALMDPLLAETIATYLAYDIAYAITQNGNVQDRMYGLYQQVMMKAKSVDGQEDSRMQLEANEWDDSRLGRTLDRSGR